MHWKTKARLQSLVAMFPGFAKYPIYYWLQKNFGALGNIDVRFELDKAAEIMALIEAQGRNALDRSFFEVGTGRTVNTEIGLWLCGAGSITAVDLNPYLAKELVEKSVRWLQANPEEIEAAFAHLNLNREEFNKRSQALKQVPADMEAVLNLINLRYLAPCDAANMDMEDGVIDYHISTNVLEHVPAEDIKRILFEAKRLLKDDGLLVHRVDPSDHFAHSDPGISSTNFLRFSQQQWDKLSNNTFSYHNRLRVVDFYKLFTECGVEVLEKIERIDERSLDELQGGFPIHEEFKNYSNQELATTFFAFTGKF